MKTIGKYEIQGLLGRGGMSRVYKVSHPHLKKIAAIKRLEPNPMWEGLIDPQAVQRQFAAEARTMAGIRHPNILGVWDYDWDGNRPFYLMEYYPNNLGTLIGESYRTEMPSRIIRLDKAIHYIGQTLKGLARLHYAGIIHRDVKPFNLMITDEETVKIGDFGLSKLRGERFQGPPNLKVGSPWYAAPEQEAHPESVDFTADLYAVGVTLYRMLTGQLPLADSPRPSAVNPDLDDDWDRFLEKAMAADPRARHASAGEMGQVLHDLEAAWQARQEQVCALPLEPRSAVPVHTPLALRKTPRKVRPSEARNLFDMDALWRPAEYIQNQLEIREQTVTDQATQRVWQRAGAPYPLTWHQAHAYIHRLNQAGFAGREDWRLPTVNELLSLLTPTPHGADYCVQPAFDRRQRRIWSCDRRSFMAAWYVDNEMGFAHWQDFTAPYYVRAVCDQAG